MFVHIPERGLWRLSKEQVLVLVFWAKWDPIWAKWEPSGQFVRKVGKSALESLGKKNTIIIITRWSGPSGGKAQGWLRVQSQALCLRLSPGNHSQKLFKDSIEALITKSMAELLGQCSCTALVYLTGNLASSVMSNLLHIHKAFSSLLQSLKPAQIALRSCPHSLHKKVWGLWILECDALCEESKEFIG